MNVDWPKDGRHGGQKERARGIHANANLLLFHPPAHHMDPSYQTGQSSDPLRKPDLKKKLVVVGDGALG